MTYVKLLAQKTKRSSVPKTTIVKEQMAEWLFSAVYLLDRCSIPLMSNARSKLEDLKKQKIEDQKEITRKRTIESEQDGENRAEILLIRPAKELLFSPPPKKIARAVQMISKEDDRSEEVIVFGVPEEQGGTVASKVTGILEQLEKKPQVADCRRLGVN